MSCYYNRKTGKISDIGNPMTCWKYDLITAASHHRHDVIEYLIQRGTNLNPVGLNQLTALKTCAKEGNFESTKLILDNGADPNYERDDENALAIACDQYSIYYNRYKLDILFGDLAKIEKRLTDYRKIIVLLLFVTNASTLPKAYEYSCDPKIRQLIKDQLKSRIEHDTSLNQILLVDQQIYGGSWTKMDRSYGDRYPTDNNESQIIVFLLEIKNDVDIVCDKLIIDQINRLGYLLLCSVDHDYNLYFQMYDDDDNEIEGARMFNYFLLEKIMELVKDITYYQEKYQTIYQEKIAYDKYCFH